MSQDDKKTTQLCLELDTLKKRILSIEKELQGLGQGDFYGIQLMITNGFERPAMDIFRLVFENVADGIVIADVRSKQFILCNPAFARMIGRPAREITSLRIADIHPASDLPRVQDAFQKQAEGIFTLAEDIPVLKADGSVLYTEVNSFPVMYKGKQCLMGVFRDVTRRKHAQTLLEESERKYRTLVESAGASIAVVDKEGVFYFVNHTAAAQFQRTPQDLTGKTMWDLFPREVADQQMATIYRVIESEQRECVVSLTVIGSESRWYDTTIEPLRDDDGVVDRVLIVARDIHEYKQAQEQLARYREDMMRAEHLASLGTLSAMFAHELNQPLTVIRLSLENVLSHADQSQGLLHPIKEELHEGLVEMANVITIVNRFRDFARRSSDRSIQPVDLWTIARKVFDLLGSAAEQAQVSLQSEGLRELPNLLGNTQDMTQLLFSLIENAIQAADGRQLHTVVVKGAANDGHIELHVCDDCGGIDEKHLSRIFEPFYTTKQDTVATGLGLCVVERIIEHMGGTIRIESQWGKGSDFIIRLPISQDE